MASYHYSETHRNRLMVSKAEEETSLKMTDYFFLASLFLLVFWALDPAQNGFDNNPILKRFPSVLLGLNMAFVALGVFLFYNARRYITFKSVVLEMRYLMMFSVLVVAGSLYAKYRSGIDETFLTFGLYVWVAPLTYWYVINSSNPMRLVRAILYVFIFWALVATTLQFVFFMKVEAFHNREHLVVPLVGAMLYYLPWKATKWLALLALPTLAIATNKNTSFILTLFSLTYLLGISLYRRLAFQRDGVVRAAMILMGVLGALGAVGVSAVLYVVFEKYMPTGNPEYRLHMYGVAWDKFMSSPIWGNLFTRSAVEYFGKYDVLVATQNLPTHSDPLDILANGGLLAFGLWFSGLLKQLWPSFKVVVNQQGILAWKDELPHHCFLLMSVAGLFVCMFNPIHNIPNLAAANWMAFGMAAVLARLNGDKVKAAPAPAPRKKLHT